jgi:hypothetical protein
MTPASAAVLKDRRVTARAAEPITAAAQAASKVARLPTNRVGPANAANAIATGRAIAARAGPASQPAIEPTQSTATAASSRLAKRTVSRPPNQSSTAPATG